MAEKEKKDISQTDLNLAVNYMVIERVLRCLSIYDTMCEEHNILPYLFEKAADCELNQILDYWAENNEEVIHGLFDKLHNLFGLDKYVLFGKRQIKLGIEVDPEDDDASYLSSISMEELSDHIEEQKITNIPWPEAGIRDINHSIDTGIGNATTGYETDLTSHIRRLQCNPIGINIFGIFILHIKSKDCGLKSTVDKNLVFGTSEDEINDLFDTYFSCIKEVEHVVKTKYIANKLSLKEGETYFDIYWQDNVYSIDSIIYSIARKMNYTVDGYKTNGAEKHKILDDESKLLPFPLVFNSSGSELILLINTLIEIGYTFAPKYTKMVKYSSIQEEIKHCNVEINILQSKLETSREMMYDIDSNDVMGIGEVERHIEKQEELEQKISWLRNVYIPDLERSQLLFNQDKDKWLADYTSMLKSKKSSFEEQQKQIEEALAIKEKLFSQSDGHRAKQYKEALKSELLIVCDRIDTLTEGIKRATNRARQKKPIPLIIVMEPYYEYVPILEYSEDKPRKKASTSKQ